MDEQQVQIKTLSKSKTKMAVAVGFLGLAALAAGFVGLKSNSTSFKVAKADLIFLSSNTSVEGDLNKFSVTLKNVGGATAVSPFILNVKLGDRLNSVIKNITVVNSLNGSDKILRSDSGSFNIPIVNNLLPGKSITITYLFAITSNYSNDKFPVVYTWDTTNVVSESNESNMYYELLSIIKNNLVKTPYQYWCLNFEKQCMPSNPIVNISDPNCAGNVYYGDKESCQQAGQNRDYFPTSTGFFQLVTSTVPVSPAVTPDQNVVMPVGKEFARIKCLGVCEATVLDVSNGTSYRNIWSVNNGVLEENSNRTLEHVGLYNEVAYFELHGGDHMILSIYTLPTSSSIQFPMVLESLSNNYSFGYLNNTVNGYIYQKSGQMAFSILNFGSVFDYTVIKN
ncbi:MAG: hypothetical protein PHQ18_04715 [Patescibacteria group bacterium]|nr:hypothetical protein [Patescibacteria group bacterium]